MGTQERSFTLHNCKVKDAEQPRKQRRSAVYRITSSAVYRIVSSGGDPGITTDFSQEMAALCCSSQTGPLEAGFPRAEPPPDPPPMLWGVLLPKPLGYVGGVNFHVRKIPWRREWLPTPVFLPGESHGQRSPVGYSPWRCKESHMNE